MSAAPLMIERVETIEARLDALEFEGGVAVGTIDLLPFRPAALPDGWYFCNGDQYATSGTVGKALTALPTAFKTDWGITVSGSNISLPNLFDSDGRGYFLRAADGSTRAVGKGAAQGDAIRNIAGLYTEHSLWKTSDSSPTGPIAVDAITFAGHWFSGTMVGGVHNTVRLKFDASLVVPTAAENRPLNLGMTPAIYLGV